jgi:hypothetical protein
MVVPDLAAFVILAHYVPAFVFQVTVAVWLLVQGVRL